MFTELLRKRERVQTRDVVDQKLTKKGEPMIVSMVTLSALLLASSAFADDDASRAKLLGKWQQSDGNGEAKSTWNLESSGDSMRVSSSNGSQTVADFECNTVGKECTIEDAGRPSKVSMWFNGPKLVELETRGAQIVKRRFSITGDGDTMNLEIIPIVPPAKVQTTHFKRAPSAVAKQ